MFTSCWPRSGWRAAPPPRPSPRTPGSATSHNTSMQIISIRKCVDIFYLPTRPSPRTAGSKCEEIFHLYIRLGHLLALPILRPARPCFSSERTSPHPLGKARRLPCVKEAHGSAMPEKSWPVGSLGHERAGSTREPYMRGEDIFAPSGEAGVWSLRAPRSGRRCA